MKKEILRIFALTLALITLLSLASCVQSGGDDTSKSDDTTSSPVDDTTSADGTTLSDETTTAPKKPTEMTAEELMEYAESLDHNSYVEKMSANVKATAKGQTHTQTMSGERRVNGDSASYEIFTNENLSSAYYLAGGKLYMFGKHGDYYQENATRNDFITVSAGSDTEIGYFSFSDGNVAVEGDTIKVTFSSLTDEGKKTFLTLMSFDTATSSIDSCTFEATLDTNGNLFEVNFSLAATSFINGVSTNASFDMKIEYLERNGDVKVTSVSEPENYLLVPSLADISKLEDSISEYQLLLDTSIRLMFTRDSIITHTSNNKSSTTNGKTVYAFVNEMASFVSTVDNSGSKTKETLFYDGSKLLSQINDAPVTVVNGVNINNIYMTLYQGLYSIYLSPGYFESFTSIDKTGDNTTIKFSLSDEAVDGYASSLLQSVGVTPQTQPTAKAGASTFSITTDKDGKIISISVYLEVDVTVDGAVHNFVMTNTLGIDYEDVKITTLSYVAG